MRDVYHQLQFDYLIIIWLTDVNLDHQRAKVFNVCVFVWECMCVCNWLGWFENKCVFNYDCVQNSVAHFFCIVWIQAEVSVWVCVCVCVCVLAESRWFWQGRGGLRCNGVSLEEVAERTWEPSLLFSHLFCSVEVQEVIELLSSVCVCMCVWYGDRKKNPNTSMHRSIRVCKQTQINNILMSCHLKKVTKTMSVWLTHSCRHKNTHTSEPQMAEWKG